jgi:glycosyltransferase involved in cell wall biosynthesis
MVSVIICTHNRSNDLRRALESVEVAIRMARGDAECLVIDNNSSDLTRAVTHEFIEKDSQHFRYVFEGRPGKSFALNTGTSAARGDILAFTDDDCIVDPHWIVAIVNELASEPATVIGGRVELYDARDKPVTINTSREPRLVSSVDDVLTSCVVKGCNMAMPRSVSDAVAPFDVKLGPGTFAIAEETDLVYRAYVAGFTVRYSPLVVVHHNHGRRTDVEVDGIVDGYHRGRGALYGKYFPDAEIVRTAYWETTTAMRKLLKSVSSWTFPSGEIRHLRCLCVGFLYGLKNRLLNACDRQDARASRSDRRADQQAACLPSGQP